MTESHEECIFWHKEEKYVECWLCDILNDRDAWKRMAHELLEHLERCKKLNGKW